MKTLYFFLITLLFATTPQATGLLGREVTDQPAVDSCDDVTLTSQAEVNAFRCAEVTGTLTISGTDIRDLNALFYLGRVGALVIAGNANLTELTALASLTTVTGRVEIKDNPALTNAGLSALVSAASLTIVNNPMLPNLDGFSSLAILEGGTGLNISDNPSLTDVDGLISLSRINGPDAQIVINNNLTLKHVDGLTSLSHLWWSGQGRISINGNPMLENLNGLAYITMRYSCTLEVTNNPSLNQCCGLYGLLLKMGGDAATMAVISGNGEACAQGDIVTGGACSPCIGSIQLTSQVDVDTFACTQVTGSLIISGSDITNLEGLSGLTRVGDLSISGNDSLLDLDGLRSLKLISGGATSFAGLGISANPMLTNIDGLSSLSVIANGFIYSIDIGNNPSLQHLDGLSSITTLPGSVNVHDNESLDNIDGLRNLESLTFSLGTSAVVLNVSDNPSLRHLDGLTSLRSVNSHDALVVITNNDSLADINGLSSLESVTGNRNGGFEISGNARLRNLDGLSSLRRVDGGHSSFLSIENNEALEHIDGLSSLGSGGRPLSFYINDNPALDRFCGIFPYLFSVYSVGYQVPFTSHGNGMDLTVAQILAEGPCVDFTANMTAVCEGAEITFTLAAPVIINNLVWNFGEGALPAVATGAGPHTVKYELAGNKTVVLAPDSFPLLTKADYIAVNPNPEDKPVLAEDPFGSEGHSTRIDIIDPQPDVLYLLRLDADDSPVDGPSSGSDLQTGPLYVTAVFNVAASSIVTGCTREMTQLVTVTIDPAVKPGVTAQLFAKTTTDAPDDLAVFPNPGNGNFDVLIDGDYEGALHFQIRHVSGAVVINEMLNKSADVLERNYDLSELHGAYLLSVRYTEGEENGLVRYVRLIIRD